MNNDSQRILFTCALLKVASRCNINCDYCYVYNHNDQSWRYQPTFMSPEVIDMLILRLNEYVSLNNLKEFTIVFHGGEPLLFGIDNLSSVTSKICSSVPSACKLSFSIQTNGTLLTEEAIQILDDCGVGISISIDGPKQINDLHRLTHTGASSFDETYKALQLLCSQNSKVFNGVISVIDPTIDPKELFEFFKDFKIPQIDFLLPDATYVNPPPGRIKDPYIYQNWLIKAFTLWFHEYSDLPIKWFDSILSSQFGVLNSNDAMGFGEISLIVIDTDGTYSDHDVFKITNSDRATLKESIFTKSFKEIESHPYLREHARLITYDGLSKECKVCPAVETCAGGSVMHRFHPSRGLNTPTVYCQEFYNLISHSSKLIESSLNSKDMAEKPKIILPNLGEEFNNECRRWRTETENVAKEILRKKNINNDYSSAAAVILREKYKDIYTQVTSDTVQENESLPNWLGKVRIQYHVTDVVFPFLEDIKIIEPNSKKIKYGISTLNEVSSLLNSYDQNILESLSLLISDIAFVESKDENENGIFSFSDDKAPNVIYISPFVGNEPVSAEDLSDSILHEFLHHVLYHIEGDGKLLHNHLYPHFPARWKKMLRPSGGFLHGTFVFTYLTKFWISLLTLDDSRIPISKIEQNFTKYCEYSSYGINTIKRFGLLTKRGIDFIDALEKENNYSKKIVINKSREKSKAES